MRFVLVVAVLLVAPMAVVAQDYDCNDFSTQREAQRVFDQAGAGDPYRLDRDGDGVACETLP